MNQVIIIGNLTRDPELSQTSSGISRCTFSVAVNRTYTQEDGERKADFINCIAWRNQADYIAKHGKKGGKIAVRGAIQMRDYETKNGEKRNLTEIIVENSEFIFSKSSDREKQSNVEIPASKKYPALQSFDDDGECPF